MGAGKMGGDEEKGDGTETLGTNECDGVEDCGFSNKTVSQSRRFGHFDPVTHLGDSDGAWGGVGRIREMNS